MRIHELDMVYDNVKLLNDMLKNYQPGGATQSDKEIMKVSSNSFKNSYLRNYNNLDLFVIKFSSVSCKGKTVVVLICDVFEQPCRPFAVSALS